MTADAQADASCRAGIDHVAHDRLDDALECFKQALLAQPGHDAARAALQAIRADLEAKAAAIEHHRGGNIAAAEAGYRDILSRRPRYPEILNNLGVLRLDAGDPGTATGLFRQAIASRPGLASAHANLGAALKQSGQYEAAIEAYRAAIGRAPDSANARYNLGHALVETGQVEEAVQSYEAALRCDPDHAGARVSLIHQRRHLCDWRRFEQDSQTLRELVLAGSADVPPFDALITFDDPGLQLACARQASARAARGACPLSRRTPRREGRIRLGYLSSDFRRHPVAWLVSGVIEQHDRERFEVIAYSHGPDDRSEERRRLERAFDRFVDVRAFSLDQAAARIHADGIDVLVDLNGHTMGARTGILARRPAPVQVAWLGYPGTMGADFIDCAIGDGFATPPDLDPWFTERIVRLPGCFQPRDTAQRPADHTPSRAELGLPAQGFVFCCFNNSYKITPQVFGVWMRILDRVPDSVLWLLDTTATARANLVREAAQRGVSASRLVFAPRVPMPDYLARYRAADLFLDTLPYNAGTTAGDALLAGLPVLSCAGRCFAGRMAGSLLLASGNASLVTDSLDAYAERAIAIASDRPARARLAIPAAGPADTEAFVARLEDALIALVARGEAGAS